MRRLNRLLKLPLGDPQEVSTPAAFWQAETRKCKVRLRDGGRQLETLRDIDRRWAKELYEKIDGSGLSESAKVPQQHVWIKERTRFLSGKDFLQLCKLRINALPTKSRTSRGRLKDRACRAGCRAAETLNHVL